MIVPESKLPDCPRCGHDELWMIDRERARCYFCGHETRPGILVKDLLPKTEQKLKSNE
jgi:hypothetical protein